MEDKAFDILDRIIRQKSYDELTADELKFVDEQIGGEQAYHELKTMVDQAKKTANTTVAPSVKRELVYQFKQQRQKSALGWLTFQTPAYVNMVIIALAVTLVWFLKPADKVMVEKEIIVESPPKVDTLRIELPADTVYLKQIIKIEVPVYTASVENASPIEINSIDTGSSLADLQGLQDLLVSVN